VPPGRLPAFSLYRPFRRGCRLFLAALTRTLPISDKRYTPTPAAYRDILHSADHPAPAGQTRLVALAPPGVHARRRSTTNTHLTAAFCREHGDSGAGRRKACALFSTSDAHNRRTSGVASQRTAFTVNTTFFSSLTSRSLFAAAQTARTRYQRAPLAMAVTLASPFHTSYTALRA